MTQLSVSSNTSCFGSSPGHLRRLLPADRDELPREVQQNIDMESYRIQQTGSGKIALQRRPGVLAPVSTKQGHDTAPEELETLPRCPASMPS